MSILIIGANGNMGKRYATILDYLDKDVLRADIGDPPEKVASLARVAEGVIIATPTETHCDLIQSLCTLKKPILCEKPITKDIAKLETTLDMCQAINTPLTMVYQYKYLVTSKAPEWTYYNYFKHGGDGLAWDCIQIIGLAKGEITLDESSPIWKCRINGRLLDLGHMDAAYVHMIRMWLRYPKAMPPEVILEAHEKTATLARRYLAT